MSAQPDMQSDAASPPGFPGGERVAFVLFTLAVVGATLYMMWPIVIGPLAGLAVGSLFRPRVETRATLRGRRIAAALLTTCVVLVVLGPVLALSIWLGQAIAGELVQVASRIDELIVLLEALAERAGPLGPSLRELGDSLTTHVSSALPSIAARAGDFAGALGSFLAQLAVGLVLFCMTLYYTLVEGGAWRRRFVAMLPLRPELADGLVAHFREVSVAVLVGGVGTSLVQMVVAALGFWLLGFDAPVFWALVTGVASFVPIVGTALVYIPLAIAQGVEVGWGQGLMTFAYGMAVIGTVDNLVHPLLVRSGMHIHPLLVFFAVFGGFASFGTLGLFLGPLLMATTVAVLEINERSKAAVAGAPAA